MRPLIALALAAFVALAPAPAHAQLCGPDVKIDSRTTRNKSPLELTAPSDKALIYVFVQGGFNSISNERRVSLDRQWIGTLRSGNYFVAAVEPGTRKLCAVMRGQALAYADIELQAGQSYYFEYHNFLGRLDRIVNEDAAVLLKKISTRRISWVRGQPEPKE